MLHNPNGSLAPKSSLVKALLFIVVFIALFVVFVPVKAQTVYNLDAADKVATKDTAIYNGKVYKVYANKKGRLYFETGKLTKAGKPTRKYLTPLTK